MRKQLSFILFLLLLIPAVVAVPTITVYNNSISDDSYPNIAVNNAIKFNASANGVITSWHWVVDGVDQSNNYNNLSKSWTTPGYKTVIVSATSGTGTSANITWNPIILPDSTTITTLDSIDTTSFDNLTGSFSGSSFNLSRFLGAVTTPFTNNIGDLFYVFLYILPLLIIWVRQEKALIPAGIGIILGIIVFPSLPPQYLIPAGMFIVITFVGVIVSITKERG